MTPIFGAISGKELIPVASGGENWTITPDQIREGLAKKTDIPDLSGYLKSTDADSKFFSLSEGNKLSASVENISSSLIGYAKKTDIPDLSGYLKSTDADKKFFPLSEGNEIKSVIPEAMCSLAERISALEDGKDKIGNATAGNLDVEEITKCRYPIVLYGHGSPGSSVVPENLPEGLPWDGIPAFVGQIYVDIDAASGGLYYSVGVNAVSEWKQA